MAGGDVYISFGADTGPLEAELAKARAEVRGLSAELNKTANQMRATGAAADSDLGQHLNAVAAELSSAKGVFAGYNEELKAHKAASSAAAEEVAGLLAHFRQLTEGLTGLHEAFSSASEVFAAAFAVDQIKEWINSTQEAAEHIERLSAQLGVSTAEVQQLGAMFKLTGTDADAGVRGIERMELEIRRTNTSTSAAQAGLRALDVDVNKFRAASAIEQLEMLADAAQHFADGPAKTAAFEAINRNLVELLPLLDRGSEGFKELEKTARDAGVIMSDEDVKALAEAKEQSAALGLALTALSHNFEILADSGIAKAIGALANFIGYLNDAITLARSFGGFGTFIGMTEANQAMGMEGRDIFVHPEVLHDRNLGAGYGRKPQVSDFTTGRTGGGGKGKADHSEEQEAREAYQTEVEAARNAAMATLDTLDNEVRQHKISWDEWAKDSTAALDKEKAAIEAAANEALKSASLTSLEKQRIANEEARALAEIAKKEADDQAKAAEETQRVYSRMLGTIDGELNSVLSGMLSGSRSWQEQMDKLFEDLAVKAVEELGKIAIAEAAIGIGGLLGGPVGAAIGGAGAAALPSFIPHFDTGAWELPADTLAMVHRGEMVMPAAEAGSFRDMLSGRGGGPAGGNVAIHPTTNFHVNAIDGASAASWMRSNGPSMMKAIDEAVRHGAHLGLRRLNGR